MKAPQLVEAMARYLNELQANVRSIDRCLAENGLRSQGRGVNAPEMTLRDGLRLLIGLMGRATIPAPIKTSQRSSGSKSMQSIEIKVDRRLKELIGVSAKELDEIPLLEVLERVAWKLRGGTDVVVNFVVEEGSGAEVDVEFPAFSGEDRFTGLMDRVGEGNKRIHRTITVTGEVLGMACQHFGGRRPFRGLTWIAAAQR